MAFPNVAVRRSTIAPPPPRPVDKLPKSAKSKYTRLLADAHDASDHMSSSTRKLNAEIARSAYSAEAAKDPVNVEALERARERQRKAHEAYVLWQTLTNRLNRFVASLTAVYVVGEYRPDSKRVRIDTSKGKTLKDQVAAIRKNIECVKFEIEAAKRAPLPKKDREARARNYLQELIDESKPSMTVGKDGAVSIGIGAGAKRLPLELTSNRAVFGAAVALVGIDASLQTLLPQLDEIKGAMSVQARRERIDELAAQLLALEHEEESLVEAAAADGQIIPRRPDADCRALLGVTLR